ncbi:helix-turn-helix domain-containing protein [Mycobacterium sp. Aquia_216]|uniref:PucR family transcriptional regulator n=1 Tax=Mycobacterium sp. Aquia_216 TaxID=2991729 RepID=UPI00227C82CE|nr:helix-turn-helix domain-containing protein [Mycobacterium sp. Aquia_216]WAJ42735.1 helix-turn-helix domain-containing protein [Mycobacterium sp. Aquia_216]
MAAADVDAQVVKIGSILNSQVDDLVRKVVAAIRSEVDFYKNTAVLPDDELVRATSDNLRFVFQAIEVGTPFDTSPAVVTGGKRAEAGVPLPAVMDAFRVASHQLWEVMIELAGAHPDISGRALIVATSRFWNGQDLYTDAMTRAYRQQATYQVVEDEAERAALAEALLDGRPTGDYSLWEIAQLLRIPARGPYLVVAATTPTVGKQALPGISEKLRSADIFSAWRLLPDLQTGIAYIPSTAAHDKLLELLKRVATTRVGVSPLFDDLVDTAQALRYARIALTARATTGGKVTVFEDSVLGVAAVSAPEVNGKLAHIVLGTFTDLPSAEQDVLGNTFAAWLDNKGSVSKAAEQLICHPNTVRYRLRRIEEHTGRSLSEPRELAELCLGFEIYQRMS